MYRLNPHFRVGATSKSTILLLQGRLLSVVVLKSWGANTSMRPLVVKLVFSLYTLVTPLVFTRASGFLSREAVICLERTSIRAGFFSPDT